MNCFFKAELERNTIKLIQVSVAFQIGGYGLAQDQVTWGEEVFTLMQLVRKKLLKAHLVQKKFHVKNCYKMLHINIILHFLPGYIFQPTSVVIITKNIHHFRILTL